MTSADTPYRRGSAAARGWRTFRRWRRGRPFWGGLLTILAALWSSSQRPPTARRASRSTSAHRVPRLGDPADPAAVWHADAVHPGASGCSTGSGGAVIASCALIGLNLGGFFIGMLLGMVGGALGRLVDTVRPSPAGDVVPGPDDPSSGWTTAPPSRGRSTSCRTSRAEPAGAARRAGQPAPTAASRRPAPPAQPLRGGPSTGDGADRDDPGGAAAGTQRTVTRSRPGPAVAMTSRRRTGPGTGTEARRTGRAGGAGRRPCRGAVHADVGRDPARGRHLGRRLGHDRPWVPADAAPARPRAARPAPSVTGATPTSSSPPTSQRRSHPVRHRAVGVGLLGGIVDGVPQPVRGP